MCAGDMTLEPAMEAVELDGWGVTHHCRNFDAIREFAEAHSLGSEQIIDMPHEVPINVP